MELAKSTRVSDLKEGQWIVYDNPRLNARIVDLDRTRDGLICIRTDFGNGGEPAASFFKVSEKVFAASSRDARTPKLRDASPGFGM